MLFRSFHQEASEAGTLLVTRTVAWALAAVCGVVFVLFAGVAVMLGILNNQFHWVLLVVPGSALSAMLFAITKAKAPLMQARFPELKAQIANDIEALKAAS